MNNVQGRIFCLKMMAICRLFCTTRFWSSIAASFMLQKVNYRFLSGK